MIAVGTWVTFNDAHGRPCGGLVVGCSSNGITRTLVVRTDLGGPDVYINAMWCEVAPPPRSRPVLVVDNERRA